MEEIFNHLRKMEVALHQHEIRTNPVQLTLILHPDFLEIGYSGKTHRYNSTIEGLSSENPSNENIFSQDFSYTKLAPTVIQLNYSSALKDKQGNLTRHAKRTSIWVKESGNWKLRFHQGTPTNAVE